MAGEQNDSWYSRSNSPTLSRPESVSSHSSIKPLGISKETEKYISAEMRVALAKFAPEMRCIDIVHIENEISRKKDVVKSFDEIIQNMHNDGFGNTPQCIQEMLKKRQLEDELESLEDKIFTLGTCPLSDCQKHHASLPENMDTDKQVRSTSPSEKDFKIVSPRKAAKIRKLNEKPEISTDNKFKELMEIDADKDNSQSEVTKTQIPAINLKLDANYNLMLQEINRMYPDTQNKLVKGFINIQATSNDNRNNIIDYLKKNNKEFILSEAYADRPLKVVIKGLPINQDKDELKHILENLNFKIVRISQLKNYRAKTYHPIFFIEVAKINNYLNIYNIKIIKLLTVKVETYRKKNRATICYKCNGFFHSARNCQMKARCLKCEENHETRNCAITTKIVNPKCINCKESGHLASWQSCPMFPKIKNPIDKPSWAQKLKQNLNRTPNTPPQ
ncbi:hypothetical protein AVEN_105737-1 [Araneus ventricosus]|uniref:CCHC-type domain-containing protein n=1 Tax=Araneus ventricosus TaxID=182803 RepID=A0A4Y2QMI2_ARAVE|nr:hypothetical protein AVEN_105737-1 [Araneus ventricosus]